ncbi:MAG: serine/threonine-protein phosphatase, partial [Candidatus Hydrogenedentes bacterium]|nr:serine/threonine-protein phosphatase [Candidatus Hydrogenedentota bacterium]
MLERQEIICTEVWGGNGPVLKELTLPGMKGVIWSQPVGGKAGGDLYYVSACSSGVILRVCLADVVGHGAEVAQISAWLREILRANMERRDPSRIFTGMNRRVNERGLDALTTAAVIHYHCKRGQLKYCYAGHPPALLYRRTEGVWKPLELAPSTGARISNVPFGVTDPVVYEVNDRTVEPGDRICVFSDGVTETRDGANTLFGLEGLQEALNRGHKLPLVVLAAWLSQALAKHRGAGPIDHDDVTFILLEVEKRKRAPLVWLLLRNQYRRFRRALASSNAAPAAPQDYFCCA